MKPFNCKDVFESDILFPGLVSKFAYYNTMSQYPFVYLDDSVWESCFEFGNKQVEKGTAYRDCGQDKKERVAEQCGCGKFGEWVVYETLKQHFPTITEPDMKIYSAEEKSWDCDLTTEEEGIKLLVKTTELYHPIVKCSASWLIQNDKKGRVDKEVYGNDIDNNYLCFVIVDNADKNMGRIINILPVTMLHKLNLFKHPKIPRLIGKKDAVYYSDLENNGVTHYIPPWLGDSLCKQV